MAGLLGKDGERYLWVLDPVTRKLRVPLSLLVPTQATTIAGTVPSLCLAFLEGRCRHPWCRQAHVMPAAIAQLRHEALNAPTCCQLHGDPHDTTILTDRFETVTISESPQVAPIPKARVALTVGLQRYLAHSISPHLRGGNLELPLKLICRLHQSQRCRYMEDCNNIHICRELDLRLTPPPHLIAPLTSISGGTQIITIADQVFSVTMIAQGEISDDEFQRLCEAHNPKSLRGPIFGCSSIVNASGVATGSSSSTNTSGASSEEEHHLSQSPQKAPCSPVLTHLHFGGAPPASAYGIGVPLPPATATTSTVDDNPLLNSSTNSYNGNWSTSNVGTPPLAAKPSSGFVVVGSGSSASTPLAASLPLPHGGGGGSSPPPPPYSAAVAAPITPTLGPRGGCGTPLAQLQATAVALRVYDVRRQPAVKC